MVPKKDESDDEKSCSSAFTSDSSDSYSYLLRDVDNPVNQVNEEWEAIERTLYEEEGKHVTDPALVKECRLWRETFPHLRVRGAAVRAVAADDGNVAAKASKSVEAVDKNQLELSRISEKRENIKKTVVSHIVERLVTKLNLNKGNSRETPDGKPPRMDVRQRKKASPDDEKSSAAIESEQESYFERGKREVPRSGTRRAVGGAPLPVPFADGRTGADAEVPSDASDDAYAYPREEEEEEDFGGMWSAYASEKAAPPSREQGTSNLARNEEIMRSGNLSFKIKPGKPSGRRARSERASDSLSSLAKPFEAAKKIDKKYESMLERILESKGGARDCLSDGRRSLREASGSGSTSKSYGESLERLFAFRGGDAHADKRRSKRLPRINNSANNWMSRAEREACDYGTAGNAVHPVKGPKSCDDRIKNWGAPSPTRGGSFRLDESLLEQLQRQVWSNGGSSPPRNAVFDPDVILGRRPQLRNRYNYLNQSSKTQKSSSCGDLLKKTPSIPRSKAVASGLDKGKSELAVKNGAKKKTSKNNENKNLQLPPIEASIICTELTGRPKVPVRSFPKKYF